MSVLVPLMRSLSGFLPTATRYGAVCCSCGAVGGVCSLVFQLDIGLAFALGFALPIWPIVWYFNSSSRLKRELQMWQQLRNDNLMSESQYFQSTQLTIDSLTRRWYGKPASGVAPAVPVSTTGATPPDTTVPPTLTPPTAAGVVASANDRLNAPRPDQSVSSRRRKAKPD